jgi:hypothetical protein
MKFSQAISFITLSANSDYTAIENHFTNQHEHFQSHYPYWSINATKRKLTAAYWYNTVFKHYGGICLLAVAILATINPRFLHDPISCMIILMLSVLIFVVIAAVIYIPSFFNSYLPLLESCMENYSGRQREGIHKCKQQQYSVMALMLIQHALNNVAGIENNPFSEGYSNLMMKQYGVSPKMIDATQRIIVLNQWDNAKERKRTEITEAFEEASEYFKALQVQEALHILDTLKVRLLQTSKKAIRA